MILITGTSGGIGKYLFNRFSMKMRKYTATYYSNDAGYSGNKNYFKLDVSDFSKATEELIKLLSPEIERFILINCAGNNYNSFAHKSNPADWTKVILTNLVGTYNMIRAVLPR